MGRAGTLDAVLLDPRKGALLGVVPGMTDRCDLFAVNQQAVYWATAIGRGGGPLYQAALPDFRPQLIRPLSPIGSLAAYQGRVYLAEEWTAKFYAAPTFNEPFRLLQAQLPGGINGQWCPKFALSRHYGLLAFTGKGIYRVEVKTP